MPILTSGSINSALQDGVYVFEIAPTPAAGLGVPTDPAGAVGPASWGPIGVPVPVSDTNSIYAAFGLPTTDPNDLVTQLVLAAPYGNNFRAVRVAGTSTHAAVAATGTISDTVPTVGVTLTAFYTGTVGNTVSIVLQAGSNSTSSNPTVTAILSRTGQPSETFPNLPSSSGGSFWANFVNAVNNGVNGVRGPSALVTATIGTSVAPPVLGTTTLSGGKNGDASQAGVMTGTDGSSLTRTGMYALRGTGIGQFILCGDTAPADYTAATTFGAQEGAVYGGVLPTGLDVNAAILAKNNANIANPYAVLLKDWVFFFDPVSQTKRLVSPDGVWLGLTASLPPEASPSNKPALGITNILGTEMTDVGRQYSLSELVALKQAGITAIYRPISRGNVFGFINGVNTYMVAGQDGVEYGRFTSYLARSVISILGPFVGELQGLSATDPTRMSAKAVLNQFFRQLSRANRVSAFSVQLDLTNNTQTTIAAGYLISAVNVTYMGVAHQIIVNLQGGVTVQIAQGAPQQ